MNSIGLYFLDSFLELINTSRKNGQPFFSERERYIFTKAYGLESELPFSFAQIASEVGRSRERIRQIHVKIFRKLRYLKTIHPSALKINNLLKNGTDPTSLGWFLYTFHEENLSEYDLGLFLSLASFYISGNSELVKKWEKERKRYNNTKTKKNAQKFKLLSEKIIWLNHARIWSMAEILRMQPSRIFSPDQTNEKYRQGEFYSKKLARNVFYESGLELQFYQMLESAPEVRYYVEQCENVTFSVNGEEVTYTPDATVFLNDGRGFVVEIKPLSGMVEAKTHLKLKALIETCRQKGLGFILTDGIRDMKPILSHPLNLELVNALSERFASDSSFMFYAEFFNLSEQCNAGYLDRLAAIVHLNLYYHQYPLKISKFTKKIFCDEIIKNS